MCESTDTLGQENQLQVLVVEDDRGVKRMLRFSLRAAGFDSTETSSGLEALRILANNTPDAIVLDLSLHDGMGPKVLDRLIRGGGDGNKIPVWVVISAMDVAEAAKSFGDLRDRYLTKPFDPWDLVQKLERQLVQGTPGCEPKLVNGG